MTTAVAFSPLNELPGPYEVGTMLRLLMGRGVMVEALSSPVSQVAGTDQLAVYVDDDGVILAVCLCSLSLAAAAGSALSMLPPALVGEAMARSELLDGIQENHHEVMSICSRFFNSPYSPHVRLGGVVQVDQGLSGELRRALVGLGAWCQLQIRVEDYGKGTMLLAHVGVADDEGAEAVVTPPRDGRQLTRVALAAEVVIATSEGDLIMGTARDLSLQSAYITCDTLREVGTRCTLLLRAQGRDGETRVKFGGRVVRVDTAGVAVVFTNLSETARAAIGELMLDASDDPAAIVEELSRR